MSEIFTGTASRPLVRRTDSVRVLEDLSMSEDKVHYIN